MPLLKYYPHYTQDDMHLRVYNYNTLERVNQFEAHSDYLRSIAIHPTHPYILSSSGKLVMDLTFLFVVSTFGILNAETLGLMQELQIEWMRNWWNK